MGMIHFSVPGVPVPQGSLKHIGKGRMISANPKLKAWRKKIRDASILALQDPWPTEAAVAVDLTFHMPRPKAHYGTGRNASTIKPQHLNAVPRVFPDIDKMCRAFCDAVTVTKQNAGGQILHVADGLIHDDGQVARLTAVKVYSEQPGLEAAITILEAA